jgi:hypothetical protein
MNRFSRSLPVDQERPVCRKRSHRSEVVRKAGYELIDHFVLPEAAWWDDYYCPLEKRIALLREKYSHDPGILGQLAEAQKEIDLYKRYADTYGYVFYLMRAQ